MIRSKNKSRRVLWRTGRIIEDAKGMARLRSAAFQRSSGMCECNRAECIARPWYERRVSWVDGHLHHVVPRAHGGSDVLSNVLFIRRECHRQITGEPEWNRMTHREG